MDADDALLDSAMEPASLQAFIDELETCGFERVSERGWQGPSHPALIKGGYTTSQQTVLYFADAWPYQPPLLHIPGLAAWHADREMLCIWEAEDNSQRWKTLAGMNARIVEWTAAEASQFANEETARNPEIYWSGQSAGFALVDLAELVGNDQADGQFGEFHFVRLDADSTAANTEIFDLRPGGFTPVRPGPAHLNDHRQFRARWFYRDSIDRPPRDLDEFRQHLIDAQNRRLGNDLRDRPFVIFGLIWRNAAGLVCTMLLSVANGEDGRETRVLGLRPKGNEELLLRAGPDAEVLASKRVTIVGVGAIGSHIAELLARSGVGHLRMYDYDRLFPANLIRHAAPPDAPAGALKTDVLRDHLGQYPWLSIAGPREGEPRAIWHPDAIADIAGSADLLIDATGHGGFSELAARIAATTQTAFVTAALFRGGAVARIRRQALDTDTPILERPHMDRYPAIPPLQDELEFAGTETGCLSRIHNAPPVAVVTAASIAATVSVDLLCERYEFDDEIIDIVRAGEHHPFDRVGRLRINDLGTTVDVSESAAADLVDCSERSAPAETGGILIGTTIGGRTTVASIVEINDQQATNDSYRIADGVVAGFVADASSSDDRLGYVGEWHSHPGGAPISTTDRASMMSIASQPDSPGPVLLLARHDPSGWEIEGYRATDVAVYRVALEERGEIQKPVQEASDD